MDLSQILKKGNVPSELQNTNEQLLQGIPIKQEENPVGVKRVGSLISSAIIKMLELILPLYGVESEEGRRIKRAISVLTPLGKGVTTEDLLAFFKMLGNMLSGPLPNELRGVTQLGQGMQGQDMQGNLLQGLNMQGLNLQGINLQEEQ